MNLTTFQFTLIHFFQYPQIKVFRTSMKKIKKFIFQQKLKEKAKKKFIFYAKKNCN